MSPAFDSPKQAAALALLLLFLLAAPWLAAQKWLPEPKPSYSSESIRWERFPWVQKFIFEETNDIDIAFVGSSHMGYGINTPYVQQKLDDQFGRKMVVRSICWSGAGFDGLYFITKELLAHRRVKMLVFYDECSGLPAQKQDYVPYWFRYETGGPLADLPVKDQGAYYFAAIMGVPRTLLALWTPNLHVDPKSSVNRWDDGSIADPDDTLGCTISRTCFGVSNGGLGPTNAPYLPRLPATPADLLVYSSITVSNFVFSNHPLPFFQTHFAEQFGLLAQKSGCRLVLLHLPVYGDSAPQVITESRYWPDLLQTKVAMLGIPSGRLFAGLTATDLRHLFRDYVHMNENGQRYFTTLVTPALLKLYENPATD